MDCIKCLSLKNLGWQRKRQTTLDFNLNILSLKTNTPHMHSCTHTYTHTRSSRINFRENLKKINMYIYCIMSSYIILMIIFLIGEKRNICSSTISPAYHCKNPCIFLACNDLERICCKFPLSACTNADTYNLIQLTGKGITMHQKLCPN